MLSQFIANGYRISSFEKYDPQDSKTVILRHDVDYTLNGLREFAHIEAKLNCSASYLFRVHADEYNLFSCLSWTAIQEIKTLGHEIGLHFEAMNVGRALKLHPPDLLKREKDTIEAILGQEVLTCSEHREITGVVHNTPLYSEMYDPYDIGFKHYSMDDKYFKEMRYLSDSNAHWREGNPLIHLGQADRFQVLIHADWWFSDDLLLKGPYYHPRSTHI